MPVIGLPRRRTSPAVGCRNPANMLISVVLPQPEAPMRQTNSPSLTSSERSRRATMLFPPAVNTLVTRSATRTLEKARLVTLASLAWVASIHHLQNYLPDSAASPDLALHSTHSDSSGQPL